MKKRMLSILLVMVLAFSLLPAAALAADPVNPAQADLGEDLHMTKKLELTEDGSYKLTLESWATGKTTQIGGDPIPSDIVLVLDQSGSMDDEMTNRIVTVSELYEMADSDGRTPYVSNVLFDHVVYVERNSNGTYNVFMSTYFFGVRNYIVRNVPGSYQIDPSDRNIRITRLDALKVAVKDFIDTIAAKNGGHRIAIVGFASENSNTEIFNGSSSASYNTVMNSSTNYANYSLKDATTQKDTLYASVNALDADGGTLSDRGMTLAEKILTQRTDAEGRGAAVILFTDGNPGLYGDDNGVANNAVSISKRIKNNIPAQVFTIGVFDSTNGDQDRINNNQIYSVKDYMESVSSMYSSVGSMAELYATPAPVADTSAPFYQKITGNSSDNMSLSDLFDKISEVIDVTGTTVTLKSDSVLRDVINSADFTAAPGAAVAAKAFKMADGTEDAAETAKLQYSATVPANGVIDVKGFDYSELYHTDGHPGDKLVVTITGLIPKHEGNLESNVNAGVFETADAAEAVLAIGTPTLAVAKESYVIDFNAKVNLVSNAKLGYVNEENQNGTFSQNGNVIAYQYNEKDLDSGYASLAMSGVDKAMAYLNAAQEWKEIQAIPANNIYFDDALVNHAALTYDDGSGYNAGVGTDVSSGAAVINPDGQKLLYFTFKGTGIDVYCTTDADGGYVQAALLNGAVTTASASDLVDGSRIGVRNYAVTERFNVPTVSYTDLEYGTYTVYIRAMAGSNYKLDGVRVYNPMADDESVYDDNLQEKNAVFVNLRENLINDGTKVTFDPNANKTYLEGLEEDQKGELVNVLYIDDTDSITMKRTIPDPANQNQPMLDADGQPIYEDVYQNAYEAYDKNGPKNEIYLGKNQSVIFNLTSVTTGDHYWIGLSAPESGTGKVTINDEPIDVVSAVDMYYDGFEVADGKVTITNTTDSVIALTNLKVTNETAKKTVTFGSITPKMLSAAHTQAAEAISQQNQADAITNLIRQILSSFVQQLFNNISRLFGK